MDFQNRKLLILDKVKTIAVEYEEKLGCDPCDRGCPGDCSKLSQFDFPPPPPPPTPPTHSSSSVLVLVLCILGVAFVLVSYFSIVRYRSRNSRRGSSTRAVNEARVDFVDENHGPVVDHPIWYIRTVGLQRSVIDVIPVFKYKKDERLIDGTDCTVCLSEFQEDETLRLLPKCSHAFHIHCIDTWLSSHTNCPLCRAPIVSDPNSGQGSGGAQDLNASNSVEESEMSRGEDAGVMERRDCVEENGDAETRVRDGSMDSLPMEDKSRMKFTFRVKSDLAGYGPKLEQEMEPVRRSISMDGPSASMIYLAVANNYPIGGGEGSSNTKDEGCSNVGTVQNMNPNREIVVPKPGNRNSSTYRLVKSSSLGRSLQKVPHSMRRSLSSTVKSSQPGHSRRQSSNEHSLTIQCITVP